MEPLIRGTNEAASALNQYNQVVMAGLLEFALDHYGIMVP